MYAYGGWVEVNAVLPAANWGAFFTLVNSQRVLEGKSTLSQAAQDMYAIHYSSNCLADFHEIITGGGPGYHLDTGIGSYRANNLFAALVAEAN
jgi:hypothetical protein